MDVTRITAAIADIGRWLRSLLRPARSVSELAVGALMDLTRTRSELLTENAVLRQQVAASAGLGYTATIECFWSSWLD